MLNFIPPIIESHSYNNFSMKEKTPVAKINLRGDLENKDFVSKAGKIPVSYTHLTLPTKA